MKLIALISCVFVVGCHEMAPQIDSRQAPLEQDVTPATPSAAADIERAQKKAWKEGEPTLQDLDWDAAARHPELKSKFEGEAANTLAGVSLPVLLPDDERLLSQVFVTTGDTWYTARMKGEGVTVFVKGSSAAFSNGKALTAKEREQMGQFQIYRTHSIVTLATTHFGAAYSIDIECGKPADDVRCQADTYVLELADRMRRAGGQR